MICPSKGKIVLLLFDLSEKEKRFRCSIICPNLCEILIYHVLYNRHPIKKPKKKRVVCIATLINLFGAPLFGLLSAGRDLSL